MIFISVGQLHRADVYNGVFLHTQNPSVSSTLVLSVHPSLLQLLLFPSSPPVSCFIEIPCVEESVQCLFCESRLLYHDDPYCYPPYTGLCSSLCPNAASLCTTHCIFFLHSSVGGNLGCWTWLCEESSWRILKMP